MAGNRRSRDERYSALALLRPGLTAGRGRLPVATTNPSAATTP